MLPTSSPSANSASGLGHGGQPCGDTCAFAEPLPRAGTPHDWLWCHRPAQPTRLRAPGRECAHYTPTADPAPAPRDSSAFG